MTFKESIFTITIETVQKKSLIIKGRQILKSLKN